MLSGNRLALDPQSLPEFERLLEAPGLDDDFAADLACDLMAIWLIGEALHGDSPDPEELRELLTLGMGVIGDSPTSFGSLLRRIFEAGMMPGLTFVQVGDGRVMVVAEYAGGE